MNECLPSNRILVEFIGIEQNNSTLELTMITLANLKDATAQQVFDQVVEHLMEQNAKSMRDGNLCAYRGDENMMCAAGCLIGPDEYIPQMDRPGSVGGQYTGSDWDSLIRREIVPSEHGRLIRHLQNVHDCFAVGDWSNELKYVAEAHNLVMAELG